MTHDEPPRRSLSVRARLLSVTGIAVVASLLVWHAQIADFVGLDSAGDKAPVVAASGAAGDEVPAPPVRTATAKPKQPPTKSPRKTPKPERTPTADASTPSSENGPYDEESTDGMSAKLRSRLLKAMAAAKADGVVITITSGRRSAAKQQRLFDDAVRKYGSYRLAARWVLPPEYSEHVKGRAVDVGPAAGMAWLNRNGYRYGICRRYDNEPWHFEATTTPGRKCPPREPYAVAKR
ncbi:D-alanyl-D-alanine carboxypeptidase family protein [Kribbella sp. CA-253562]|uniref:M15 family metallopeptidase n=1 Tax=Kribbella sp. CA-253562 TaxID=3239942 RepID=UPI003D8BC6E9